MSVRKTMTGGSRITGTITIIDVKANAWQGRRLIPLQTA